MERVTSPSYRPVHQGFPDFKSKLERANDLTQLQNEAQERRQQHVADACARLRGCVLIGASLHADDINVVQTFIGSRTVQDRYGR
jgi:hypothetical protein